jgi:hypothetical protein
MTSNNQPTAEQPVAAAGTDTNKPAGQPETQAGRASNGRFRKGCSGGPGNPYTRQTAQMRKVMLETVSEDDLRDITKKLVEKAKEGDLGASKLVLSYVVGKPTVAADPDQMDVEEFDLFTKEAKSRVQVMTPINGVPASFALELLRTIVPEMHKENRKKAAQRFADYEANLQAKQAQAAAEVKQEPPQEVPPLPSVEEIVAFARCVVAAADGLPCQAPQPASTQPIQDNGVTASVASQEQTRAEEYEVGQDSEFEDDLYNFVRWIVAIKADAAAREKQRQGEAAVSDAADSKRLETVGRAANPCP